MTPQYLFTEPAAIVDIITKTCDYDDTMDDPLESMRVLQLSAVTTRQWESPQDLHEFYSDMASEAARFLQNRFDPHTMAELLWKKHQAYTAAPLIELRHQGIIFRLSSKVARMESLARQGREMLLDESVQDTAHDIIGYCILGILLSNKEKNGEL